MKSSKVPGMKGKEKNDLVGIEFYDKEPEVPSDMITPRNQAEDDELEWRDRCERADRKADKEMLHAMRDKSKKRYGGFGKGWTRKRFQEVYGYAHEVGGKSMIWIGMR